MDARVEPAHGDAGTPVRYRAVPSRSVVMMMMVVVVMMPVPAIVMMMMVVMVMIGELDASLA